MNKKGGSEVIFTTWLGIVAWVLVIFIFLFVFSIRSCQSDHAIGETTLKGKLDESITQYHDLLLAYLETPLSSCEADMQITYGQLITLLGEVESKKPILYSTTVEDMVERGLTQEEAELVNVWQRCTTAFFVERDIGIELKLPDVLIRTAKTTGFSSTITKSVFVPEGKAELRLTQFNPGEVVTMDIEGSLH